jgi:hypothetical protein
VHRRRTARQFRGSDMRLDAVEIKVTVDGAQVGRGLEAFGLGSNGRQRNIYFCEDVTSSASTSTPLLDLGVVLRARETQGNGIDSTIKLRPCRRSQLTDHWLDITDGAGGLKLEADWAGTRRVLAASCTADRPDRSIAQVRAGAKALRSLFSAKQEQFLTDCAGIRVNLGVLTLLGPVAATRWEPSHTAAPDPEPEPEPELNVVAERWIVENVLDFLELSIRVDPDAADVTKLAFEELVRHRGLQLDPNQDTKTRRVLEYLVSNLTRTRSRA